MKKMSALVSVVLSVACLNTCITSMAAPVKVDTSAVERVLNMARIVSQIEHRNIPEGKLQAILEEARPCVAQGLGNVDQKTMDSVLRYFELSFGCLTMIQNEEFLEEVIKGLRCFEKVPNVPQENLDMVDKAVGGCFPDDLLHIRQQNGAIEKAKRR
ncbi:hypothetical protein BIW11_10778 [Tropilaelaps mercedesae]|uniref:Secreted protein n=1 Tax=Tropilaelaps mercedesae TaxID=418985 RepID=A0A1V9XEM5_9ACAR|nr:hypothetical protein BIW11_10778 [Tropilaelaps mercedesae]